MVLRRENIHVCGDSRSDERIIVEFRLTALPNARQGATSSLGELKNVGGNFDFLFIADSLDRMKDLRTESVL